MDVLHIETGRHLYGGALQVLYLLDGLQKRGIKNCLVCPMASDIAGEARSKGILVYEVPCRGDLDISFFFRLIKIIKKETPRLIHVHSRRGADIWGGLAAKVFGIPALITRRVDNPEQGFFAKKKYRMYKKVITISEGIRNVVLTTGISSEKVICVRSAIDTDSHKRPYEKKDFYKKIGIAENAITIGTIAQLIPRKGHADILIAAPQILKRFPQSMFLFFGKGPLLDELKKMCRDINIEENVKFMGFRKDLPEILPCLDLIIHPAHMEGLGVSLIEASYAGVPIVASRAGGIPEIVRDGENGLLFESGNIDELVKACSRILSDKGLAGKMGESGRRLVEREFSTEKMVEGNLSVYKEVLGTA